LWYTHAERLSRTGNPRIVTASDIPADWQTRLSGVRAPIDGLDMSVPQIMGILNVTPDSFSDGGLNLDPTAALASARAMVAAGAAILDIGGESTRPGAETVAEADEIARTAPVIAAIRGETRTPVSIDTRKAAVAQAALAAGATLVNDVSGFTYDPALAPLCAGANVPVCVMHAQGDPATMQTDPQYDNVLLDVYDYLSDRVSALESAGIPRARIVIDPGIGFGKTLDHNLALLQSISLFHGIGCAILLGASRKRFIGSIGNEPRAHARAPGSIAVGLAALGQGVQFLRVHDVAETLQAVHLWRAVQ
jgi:dihydropteroate synthase